MRAAPCSSFGVAQATKRWWRSRRWRSRFARGRVVEIITPSPERVTPPCGNYEDCGGCQLEFMDYGAQLRHKTEMVREAVARIGGLPGVQIADTWGMEQPWHYRNRAEYHADLDAAGRLVLGFLRHHSHEVVPADRCQVQHPLSERIREVTADLVNRIAQSPEERAQLYRLEVFVSFAQEQALVTFVGQGRPGFVPLVAEELRQAVPEVAGVLLSTRGGGRSRTGRPRRWCWESHD